MYKFIEQRDTTDALVELMKDITISNSDKDKIYNTIMMFRNTPKQQDRFVRAFGLKPPNFRKESIQEIAQSYNCSVSAIHSSLLAVQSTLYRIPYEYFLVIKEIYEKYKN